jgi:transcriptional regulator with XRE-family HTH domain
MKREELLRTKEYAFSQIQLGLLNVIGEYKEKMNLKDVHLADQLGVSKGYISQLLNVTFDHKMSKLVELALACNKMPLVYFVDLDTFIKEDAQDKVYEIFPVGRTQNVTYDANNPPLSKGPRDNYSFTFQEVQNAID